MLSFEQVRAARGAPDEEVEVWEHFVQESGYSGMTIGVVGLLVLLIPFRRHEMWAWGANSSCPTASFR